jgi:hypothetical protein
MGSKLLLQSAILSLTSCAVFVLCFLVGLLKAKLDCTWLSEPSDALEERLGVMGIDSHWLHILLRDQRPRYGGICVQALTALSFDSAKPFNVTRMVVSAVCMCFLGAVPVGFFSTWNYLRGTLLSASISCPF